MDLEGRDIFVGASIGVAMHPPLAGDINALMNRADQAMYAAKHAGRNRVEVADALPPPVSTPA